ncbi:transcriptional regulator, LysR family [Kribbella flavida DSM 17836]|uniref:Transcriptional regulator, LysR family n=1 Tax=Kribbella flavida (strain DSM 17836 / JCM 10339 / NBRC 14399) TaxID=479435 RepID=D2PZI9_KRIFD|nr:LysR family transcriptional regulator [Kribbella flavida]ADB35555.1 transcriptional regulator, LysR family [Kribbella flavida DSM 17836]
MATLRQLEYLVTVVDQGSFTRAAELLHVTQPALSHQIRALERSAGGPLLERLPKNLRLTPTGRAMLPHARAALADAERARCAARQAAGLETGELQIATLYSVSLGILPAALKAWRRQYADVGIRLFEHRHTDELAEAMTTGQADLAIGPSPAAWTGSTHRLGIEEFVVVLASDDALASSDGEQAISLTELAERAWVHYTPGHGLADLLDQACAQAGFQPRIAVRTEQTAAAPALAAAGLGPALVPANILPAGFDGLVLRPDPPICRTLTAYTRGTPDSLSAAFIEVIQAAWPTIPGTKPG